MIMRRRVMMNGNKLHPDNAPNGVYILDIYGYLVRREDWSNPSEMAVGVAVLSDNCKFVISPSEFSPQAFVNWGGGNVLINNIVTTGDEAIAAQDYAGLYNTDQIESQIGPGGYTTIYICRNTTFSHGKKAYFGALGEWQEAYNNKAEIDACMRLIGGKPLDTGCSYWTSTQVNSRSSWETRWPDNKVRIYDKGYTNLVRAFAAL